MAITPNTELRLIKCNLNLDNNNQLTFASAEAQYNYFNSLPHLTITQISYQRKDEYIRYPAHIDSLIEYNYVMYKNSNYTNKWFYAYINKMEYENDNCTRVYIKTDVFQTWQFNLTYMKSFVEREHVNNDTIGLHTVPENLETGEYIINATDYIMYDYNTYPVVAVSSVKNTGLHYPTTTTYSNVFSGTMYYTFTTNEQCSNFIKIMDQAGQGDAIVAVFMVPGTLWNKLTREEYTETEYGISVTYSIITATTGIIIEEQKSVSMQTSLNGYTPKNNKVKCYPYNFLEIDNNNGASCIYHYEKFVNNAPKFQASGCITPGCSIMCYPLNYNLKTDDHILTSGMLYSYNDGIPAGKYPICSWKNDVYTNWLTQNGVSVGLQYAGGVAAAITGAATGNLVMAAGGIGAVASTVAQQHAHALTPDVAKGNINSGDVTFAMLQTMFAIKKKSIKAEYAKIIDDFFSMYGYKVNSVKVPNITGRSNWNYVKMINPNIEAYIPQEDLQEIKDLFTNGITLWHTTTHFLDYSQNNSII
jgi:hypothetical protein